MTPDWQQITCPKCHGDGWMTVAESNQDGRLCPACLGNGSLVAETLHERSIMNPHDVVGWLADHWSLLSGAIAAGLASFASNSSLQMALIATASYLFGHAGGKASGNAVVQAHLAHRSMERY